MISLFFLEIFTIYSYLEKYTNVRRGVTFEAFEGRSHHLF